MVKKWHYYLYLVVGIICLVVFVDIMFTYQYPEWFYNSHPDVTIYWETNVVSPWANLSYFSYLTLILFGVYCILLFFSKIKKNSYLEAFLTQDLIVSFIVTNYLVSMIGYSISQLVAFIDTGVIFGMTTFTFRSVHMLIQNIFVHYIAFIFCISLVGLLNTKKTKKFKEMIIFLCWFSVMYFVMVKLSGLYFYNIEWYPYQFFTLPFWAIFLISLAVGPIYYGLTYCVSLLFPHRSGQNKIKW